MGTERSQRNLIISGIGTTNGGDVQLAKIEGTGKVEGDLDCNELIINGTGDIRGGLTTAKAEINGTASVAGSFRADRLNVQGTVSVGGDCTGERMAIHGSAKIQGKCEAETFEAHGKLQINALNAGLIQISLHGNSRIEEIGGEEIRIRKEPGIDFAKWLKALPLPLGNKLSSRTIEGDIVYLEYTTADVVRGNDVTIGAGCEIGLVEYKGKLVTDPNAQVKKVEKR
jgi:cytoskeletal protein CcmA (bactofilin family)